MALVKIIPFFNPIYISEIDVNLDHILNSIIKIKDNDPGVDISNVGGWQSRGYAANEKLFMTGLLSRIEAEVSGVYEDLGITKKPKLGTFWFNINEKHHYNLSHNHPGSYVSAVMYLSVPKNSGQIVFERPDPFHDWIHDIEPMENNVAKILQQPKNNMLLIFPSYIRHYVEINQSDEPRISIALNYR